MGMAESAVQMAHAEGASNGASGINWLDRWLLGRIVERAGRPPVAMTLWDGDDVYCPAEAIKGRIRFCDRGALWSSILNPEVGFGDCYSAGRIVIEGDFVTVLREVFRSIDRASTQRFKRDLLGRIPKAARNTRAGSQKHIEYHYDLGNDFYRLWLDERMVYTCAYFETAAVTLEQAQLAKMDLVCRKVALEPGMRVIEAGCGWGSLALHMAEHYGVEVRAFNLSAEQVEFARERAKSAGLEGRVEFIQDDYRNITGVCDAFVSVGMLEHVGPDNYETLADVIHRSLARDGQGLIHSVGRSLPTPPSAWLEKRIFPGSYPPSLREMMSIFEPHQLSIIDVENLRLHYAKTLMEWLQRFENNVDKIRQMYDDNFVRAWRLYLGGCAAGFASSSTQLYQVVFARPEHNTIPMTRGHLHTTTQPTRWKLD